MPMPCDVLPEQVMEGWGSMPAFFLTAVHEV